jgi:HK97 family phage portal protein
VLATKPNHWQTSYVFRRLMQHRVLVHGNAYALVIRARGRVSELVPLDPTWVTPKLSDDWTLTYEVRRKSGGTATYGPEDILHLMGPSEDGVKGLSLVSYAGEVLGLSLAAQRAAGKLFKQGMLAGGMLSTDGKLSQEAVARLREQMDRFQGAEMAGKWLVGEEGVKAQPFGGSAKDSQNLETRQHQVEEVARIFGVPRPFLMVDDTSWGSGIEQLGIFFVQYGLAPHFVCWEQAIERTCLSDAERGSLDVKFNERALLRGSMKDQAEFFARALGSGGGRPWMMQDEVRDLQELRPAGGDAAVLGTAAGQPKVTIGE